jgi:hypothetical protein
VAPSTSRAGTARRWVRLSEGVMYRCDVLHWCDKSLYCCDVPLRCIALV